MVMLNVDNYLDKKAPVSFGIRRLTGGRSSYQERWQKSIRLYSSRPMKNISTFLQANKDVLWGVPDDDVIYVSWGGYTKGRFEETRGANLPRDQALDRGRRTYQKRSFGPADLTGLPWLIEKAGVAIFRALGIITYGYFLRIGIGQPKKAMRGEEFSVPLFELNKDRGRSFSLGQVLRQLKSHELYEIAMYLGDDTQFSKHDTWDQLGEAYNL